MPSISVEDVASFIQEVTPPLTGSLSVQAINGNWHRYYNRLDRLYTKWNNNGGGEYRLGYHDPIYLDGGKPATNYDLGVSGSSISDYQVGEWDKVTSRQRLYTWSGYGGANRIRELSPTTLLETVTDPYPNVRHTCSTIASPNDGYYEVGGRNEVVIFESQGYMIAKLWRLRWNGGILYDEVMGKIDLSTGAAEPIEDLFARAQPGPSLYQEPAIHGEVVKWWGMQFVPDDDSTALEPKGYIFQNTTTRALTSSPKTFNYYWVRKVEWNPLEVTGTPTRVHKRDILTSRLEFNEQLVNPPTGQQIAGYSPYVHPVSGLIYMFVNYFQDPTLADSQMLYKFAVVPDVTDITAAAPQKLPQTSATIPFVVEVLGSLGEPVLGETLDWSIEAGSTVDERFDGGTVGVGGTHTLVNGPADSGTITVIEDPDGAANVLTEGVEYTVTGGGGGTGVQGVGPTYWQALDYAVYYEHKESPISPSHGTLLETSSQSDISGQAICRVRYPDDDDLVGAYDVLSAETS